MMKEGMKERKRRKQQRQKKRKKPQLTAEQIERRARKKKRKEMEEQGGTKGLGTYVPIAVTNQSNTVLAPPGPDRASGKDITQLGTSTYHIGYESRETSSLHCADAIHNNAKLYENCGPGGNEKCRLLHYPWVSTSLYTVNGPDGNKRPDLNATGQCGKLVRIFNKRSGKSIIARLVDIRGFEKDLDLEPAAFNGLDDAGKTGFLNGTLDQLQIFEAGQDW
jgi:rare lipoprotein A (peptidoglycan hydrolase)